MKGALLFFPKSVNRTEPRLRDIPARTNRRLHITAKEGRARLLAGTLPPWAVILGSLHFSEDERPMFPPNVRVRGSLTLYNCFGVTKLGNGLRVDGFADFQGTPLKRIPRMLHVNGYLDLTGTDVKGVPRDLYVREGVIVGELASTSLQALAQKQPVKWMPPVISF